MGFRDLSWESPSLKVVGAKKLPSGNSKQKAPTIPRFKKVEVYMETIKSANNQIYRLYSHVKKKFEEVVRV
jgi:hypothetical protein